MGLLADGNKDKKKVKAFYGESVLFENWFICFSFVKFPTLQNI